jgi:hypothetical protein
LGLKSLPYKRVVLGIASEGLIGCHSVPDSARFPPVVVTTEEAYRATLGGCVLVLLNDPSSENLGNILDGICVYQNNLSEHDLQSFENTPTLAGSSVMALAERANKEKATGRICSRRCILKERQRLMIGGRGKRPIKGSDWEKRESALAVRRFASNQGEGEAPWRGPVN